MREFSAQHPAPFLAIALFIVDVLLYWVFYGGAALVNTLAGRRALSKRLAGCVGAVAPSAALMWYMIGNLDRRVDALSPERQFEIIGPIVGATGLPALIVISAAAFFAWRERNRAAPIENRGG